MRGAAPRAGGDGAGPIPFREAWSCDFEFRAAPGERPWPVCMVARELHTGREHRLWREDLLARRRAPFDTGPGAVLVAYYAAAELGCFAALGWPPPARVLDLYAEHRVETNGLPRPCGDGLLGALALRGLAHLDAGEKEAMRRLVLERDDWTPVERAAVLDYCASDVEAVAMLLPRMAPGIDWPRALLRGRYMAAVAGTEHAGVPIDAPLQRRLRDGWDGIRGRLVAEVDRGFGVYDGLAFRSARFAALLAARGVGWPKLPSGALTLDDDTFRAQARLHPWLEPLRQLRRTLADLRPSDLAVGPDGRNRAMLSPFRAETGRNAPSSTRFIFGAPRWLRGLVRPPEGWGLAYIDYAAQEVALAAALSGDEAMVAAYASGDPYLAFAKDVGLAPADATKASHRPVRERCKAVVLGVNYGMGAEALAASLGVAPVEARELLRLHRRAYPRFWRWSEASVDAGVLRGEMRSAFGWRRRVGAGANPRALMNFPMQANGAEMMRLAAIAATEAEIEVCAPVHDAFLIAAPLDRLEQDVARMRALMGRAGRAVTGGLEVRTDTALVRWPDRLVDEGGAAMWARVMALLEEGGGA